jgi:hypothetical protein
MCWKQPNDATPKEITDRPANASFAVVSSSVLLILGLVIAELVERHFEDMDLGYSRKA